MQGMSHENYKGVLTMRSNLSFKKTLGCQPKLLPIFIPQSKRYWMRGLQKYHAIRA